MQVVLLLDEVGLAEFSPAKGSEQRPTGAMDLARAGPCQGHAAEGPPWNPGRTGDRLRGGCLGLQLATGDGLL